MLHIVTLPQTEAVEHLFIMSLAYGFHALDVQFQLLQVNNVIVKIYSILRFSTV